MAALRLAMPPVVAHIHGGASLGHATRRGTHSWRRFAWACHPSWHTFMAALRLGMPPADLHLRFLELLQDAFGREWKLGDAYAGCVVDGVGDGGGDWDER